MNLNTVALDADLSLMTNPHAWMLSDIESLPKNKIKVMSTFACGGGSTMGYKRAGCDVIAANDIDPEMAYHYKINLNPTYYYLCPIRDLLEKELPNELFNLDILDGSPPCSTFSVAGSREKSWGKNKKFREGQATQVLSDLFFDYLDLVNKLRPRVVIAENVKGMIIDNAKGYTKIIINKLKEIGYRPQLFLINAADCGVPQTRERVFFCALRNDIDKPKLVLNTNHRWISAGEATADLQILSDEEIVQTYPTKTDIDWWYKTKPGKSYEEAVIKEGLKAKLFNHVKLNKDKPAFTLTTKYSCYTHWSECRKLTYREWKRLGSFPDDYKVTSSRIGYYIIGMSVPLK